MHWGQVIKESQRLFPAAAIGPLRYAAKNTELAGYFIPKGTHIQVHFLSTALSRAPCSPRVQITKQAPYQICEAIILELSLQ